MSPLLKILPFLLCCFFCFLFFLFFFFWRCSRRDRNLRWLQSPYNLWKRCFVITCVIIIISPEMRLNLSFTRKNQITWLIRHGAVVDRNPRVFCCRLFWNRSISWWSKRKGYITEYPSTNLHMNRYALFFWYNSGRVFCNYSKRYPQTRSLSQCNDHWTVSLDLPSSTESSSFVTKANGGIFLFGSISSPSKDNQSNLFLKS